MLINNNLIMNKKAIIEKIDNNNNIYNICFYENNNIVHNKTFKLIWIEKNDITNEMQYDPVLIPVKAKFNNELYNVYNIYNQPFLIWVPNIYSDEEFYTLFD